jgi:hypothetical protein
MAKELKYIEIFKKSSSPEPAGQNQSNGTNYPWVKGIQICSNKGPGLLQKGGGVITKI